MEVRIVTPPVAESVIETDLVNLTKWLTKSGAAERYAGGILGGEWGYGVEFENNVFLMHPFCWCEREDCPWCASCTGEGHHPGHKPDCYQTRLQALQETHGERKPWGLSAYGVPAYDRARDDLCREMGLDPNFGSEVHCTCGADDIAKANYDACQCDWHTGSGPFRFGGATQGPNFLHKPSGLRIRWYKWIGRDTEYEPAQPGPKQWRRIFKECIASVTPSTATELAG